MTEQKVVEILSKQLRVEKDKINAETNIASDLGADSLDVVELLMTFEDEFKVSIPDEQLEELKSIPQIVKIIDENTKK